MERESDAVTAVLLLLLLLLLLMLMCCCCYCFCWFHGLPNQRGRYFAYSTTRTSTILDPYGCGRVLSVRYSTFCTAVRNLRIILRTLKVA
eukprot:SAG11_NODE_1358_length_5120_cov_1.838080_3_plen_90_part_00